MVDGPILEIGSGTGGFKEKCPHCISSDIVSVPWIDIIVDAVKIPFYDSSIGNIVAIDTIHHIGDPMGFLVEAERVLIPGGRIVLLEPAITPLSRMVFSLFHPEPVDLHADFFLKSEPCQEKKAFDGNQATGHILFNCKLQKTLLNIPSLTMVFSCKYPSLAFPLSGGYRRWRLIHKSLLPVIGRIEANIPSFITELIAFREMFVLEKA